MPYSYKKSERLRKNSEFVSAMRGRRLSVDGLSLFYMPNEAGNFRVGISVGKKAGGAVRRNLLRRRLRHAIGRAIGPASAGYDLVFVARQGLASRPYQEIQKIVEAALRKTGVIE